MENEEVMEGSRFDDIINAEMDYYETLPKNDENHSEEVKLLCQLLDRDIEIKKIISADWQYQQKLEHEKQIQKNNEEFQKKENAIKEEQIKADRLRTWSEVGKVAASIGIFALFEILAHNRDMHDVYDKASTHPKKNPIRLKF